MAAEASRTTTVAGRHFWIEWSTEQIMRIGCLFLMSAAMILFLPTQSPYGNWQCSAQVSEPGQRQLALIREDAEAGLELWQTTLGPMWIPKPGYYVIHHLEWEGTVEKVYDHPLVHVRRGDVVVDCGAHIGFFTRLALRAGARTVVAVEPERANLSAFRRNLEAELKSGQVKLVEKGLWDSNGKLSLHLSRVGDSHSVVVATNGPGDAVIEAVTLDTLARSLSLPRVDFIKMDIEGAERNALRGARRILGRWKPRLAISSYHLGGDPAAICGIVWEARSDYLVAAKDIIDAPHGPKVPKVLFFY
jgi:FkbM family methyltransferase